jgi:hypothetical protein
MIYVEKLSSKHQDNLRSSVEPKNWYLLFFTFFEGEISYDPGPITSLLYFLCSRCRAFFSMFV